MGYQVCPYCNGTGNAEGLTLTSSVICPVCKGARIINELTGLPPNGYNMSVTTNLRGDNNENKN